MLPNILCEVVKYPDLNRVCNVFNKNTIDDYFWLHLPCETTKMEFHKLFNISGQNKVEIDTTDKLGREITEGAHVIYTNVGTIGKVQDIKTDENGSWVLIQVDELTKLWYNTEYVELTDQTSKVTFNEENDKEVSIDDIKDELKNNFENTEMGDDGVGGG